MKKEIHSCLVALLLFCSSCATYHISAQSLLEQFADARKETKVTLLIAPPFFFFPGIVDGNSLRTIVVKDKDDKDYQLHINNRTGVRIRQKDGEHTTFYFNTLQIKDSVITGNKTHFVNAKIRAIKLSNISKIELQK